MTDHGVQPVTETVSELESVISGLYEKAGNFGLSREDCTAILSQIAVKYLPPGASRQETAELYGSLRIEELALARACAAATGAGLHSPPTRSSHAFPMGYSDT